VRPGFGSGLSVKVNPGCADVLTSARMGPLYTTGSIPKNYFDMQAWSVWFIWLIRFIWLVSFTQTNKTNQTDQMNKTSWRTFSASC
jgi:hypothetical protein